MKENERIKTAVPLSQRAALFQKKKRNKKENNTKRRTNNEERRKEGTEYLPSDHCPMYLASFSRPKYHRVPWP